MPLRLEMKLSCVSDELLKKALHVKERQSMMIFSDTPDEYFVLRKNSDYTKVTAELVGKYRLMAQARAARRPQYAIQYANTPIRNTDPVFLRRASASGAAPLSTGQSAGRRWRRLPRA